MTSIYLWPTPLIIIVAIAVFTVLAIGGNVVVRRLVPHRDLAHNDVAGALLGAVGVIYAVLLAFVVVIAWEAFNTAEATAQREVSAASDLYRLTQTYKGSEATELRAEIAHYAELMKADEWPAMRTGGESEAAHASADRISDVAVRMVDAGPARREVVDNALISFVHSFLDARRARLSQNDSGIPATLWVGLCLGAIITIGFTYLFGVENFRLHLVMTGLLAALIAVMFSMAIALDYPYRGVTGISSAIWSLGGR